MLDLAIIGGGPAALSAALYAVRAGLSVKVFEKADFGGILPTIPNLENYPGFSGEGKKLAQQMREQSAQAGAILEYGECTDLALTPTSAQAQASSADAPHEFLLTIDEVPVAARSVIIASGSRPRQLNFDLAIPVSYCALCDGTLARDKRIVVVGGANSAVQEALYLAGLAQSLTLITHSELKADQELIERLKRLENLKIIENTEPTAEFLNQFDYCFVYIGKLPATGFLANLSQEYSLLSRDGYILADTSNAAAPHQTVIEGLFAAGDVRFGSTRQVITAAADGAEAAIEATKWLKSRI